MQTFLPYSDFELSAQVLDYKRLGKQRVEAFQIYQALTGKTKGWTNHPATKMWQGYEDALALYFNIFRQQWINRGYKNNMPELPMSDIFKLPFWLGKKEFHSSHRANLLRKNYEYYSQFGWQEPTTLPYVWPV